MKWFRNLRERRGREAEGAFLVEGPRALSEALRAGAVPSAVLYSPELSERYSYAADVLQRVPPDSLVFAATEPVLQSVGDTATTQGIVAAFALPGVPSLSFQADTSLVLVLDRLRDPGNVGTLLRSAAAAGADAVLLSLGCADPFNPKVVRSSAGGVFAVQHAVLPWPDIKTLLAVLPRRYAADTAGRRAYYQAELREGCAILIGNEADGLSPEALDLATEVVSIPMANGFESLNAGVAGSLLLFEARKQRQQSVDGVADVPR